MTRTRNLVRLVAALVVLAVAGGLYAANSPSVGPAPSQSLPAYPTTGKSNDYVVFEVRWKPRYDYGSYEYPTVTFQEQTGEVTYPKTHPPTYAENDTRTITWTSPRRPLKLPAKIAITIYRPYGYDGALGAECRILINGVQVFPPLPKEMHSTRTWRRTNQLKHSCEYPAPA